MLKNKKILIGLVIILGIIGFSFYKKSQPKVLVGTEAKVVEEIVRKTVSASGKVISTNEADLAFASTGELAKLNVKKGDMVKEGQLLASLSNYDSSQASKSARDSRDIAQRDLDLYIQTYESNKDAVGGKKEYDINIRRLMELLSKAEANYQSSIGSLSKTYLYAPFEGTVVDTFKEEGEIVGLGEKVLKVAKLDNLVFEMDVDQEDFGLLKPDQAVEIQLDAYTKKIFTGKVLELPKYADANTEQFTVRIAISKDNEAQVLLGMKGDAKIIIETTNDKVKALTFDTIFKENDGSTYVWIDENKLLKKLPIEIGLEGDIYTELKSNLDGKTLYVPTGNVEFKEGSKVKVGK